MNLENVEILPGNLIENLDFADKTFDLITMN